MNTSALKNFKPTLELIRLIQNSISGRSRSRKASVKIIKNVAKGYKFEIKQRDINPLDDYNIDKLEIESKQLGVIELDTFIVTKQTVGQCSGIAGNFGSVLSQESQELFFRQVIVLPERLSLTEFIQDERYWTSDTSSQKGRFRVNFGDLSLDVFKYQDVATKKSFLIIDSVEQLAFKEFSLRAYLILIALGFATGKFYQNEGYYFGFDNDEMAIPIFWRYIELRDSKNAQYYPVYGNAHGIVHHNSEIADKFQAILKPIPIEVFSNLCQNLYEKPDFQALLILMLEACSSSLLLMPAGLSVVLEGLRSIIKKDNEKPFTYLTEDLAKEIKGEMMVVLEKFSDKIASEGRSVLEKKINDFDKPTNQSQLLMPFEIYKIALSIVS